MKFGKFIKALRIKNGLLQKDIMTKRFRSLVSRIENGDILSPRLNTLRIIANGLNMPTWELIKKFEEQQ
jgi:transcriptional regulator with XRE-family HTH domain